MNAKIETHNYCQLALDKFKEVSDLLHSETVDKRALANAIIDYGKLRYRDGLKDGGGINLPM